jgi:hypothetical protein
LHLDWNTLLSSGIGALIGGALTLIAAYLSHRWGASKQAEKDAQMLMGVLQAVHGEIETLWDIYMDGIGLHLEALPNGQALNTYYPVTQEYFTVYSTNAFFIALIRDNDLRNRLDVLQGARLNRRLPPKQRFRAKVRTRILAFLRNEQSNSSGRCCRPLARHDQLRGQFEEGA